MRWWGRGDLIELPQVFVMNARPNCKQEGIDGRLQNARQSVRFYLSRNRNRYLICSGSPLVVGHMQLKHQGSGCAPPDSGGGEMRQ